MREVLSSVFCVVLYLSLISQCTTAAVIFVSFFGYFCLLCMFCPFSEAADSSLDIVREITFISADGGSAWTAEA